MSSLITRRGLLKGLFAMPAIVAIGNIMPIKVDKEDVPTFANFEPSETWVLVKLNYGGASTWVRNIDYKVYTHRDMMEVTREAKIFPSTNMKTAWVDTIKQLNAIEPGNVVTERLPGTMRSYDSTKSGLIIPDKKSFII